MTNLVKVENFTLDSEEERIRAFQQEAITYLERHPKTQYVDVLLNDANGVFRGKRIPSAGLVKLGSGCYFPGSIFTMDILGTPVEAAGMALDLGEPDNICVPIENTLVPSVLNPTGLAQLLLTMRNQEGLPFDVEPRNVLSQLWQQLCNRSLFPVVAVEMEFYLIDKQRDAEGAIQPPRVPGSGERDRQAQVYSVDNLDHFAAVLNDINHLAREQGIPAESALAEASPGQFEINLLHTCHVLSACDHAVQLKRMIRLIAEQHGMSATFMAKPYEKYAGSGMHVHVSLLDVAGNNVFMNRDGSDSLILQRVMAGMLNLMAPSMALLAPNVNSFRRFVPDNYVPRNASWGRNNRTVALRIPCGDSDNHRVEYRVAGADANPYLVVAVVLASILHGLDNSLPLPPEIVGNGYQAEGLPLPVRQSEALSEFGKSRVLQKLLGERFSFVWHACKNYELLSFERLVTQTEIDWMLKNA